MQESECLFKSLREMEYKIKDTETMIRVGQRDLAAYRRQRSDLVKRLKTLCRPEFFELIDATAVSDATAEMNVIERKNAEGCLIQKWAKYWGVWKQFDEQGNFIMLWQGPIKTDTQEYPESIKQRFKGFIVNFKPPGAGEATTIDNFLEEYEKFVKMTQAPDHGITIDRSFKDPAIKSAEVNYKKGRMKSGSNYDSRVDIDSE